LRHRDYRLLAIGSLASLLGDGFFLVAIALQVYAISRDRPVAFGIVGAAWTGSAALTYLIGGWAGDRFERRRIMLSADIVRGVAVGLMGLLGVAGALRLWQVLLVGVVIGSGNAFFNPAANAILPDLLPLEDLPKANAFFEVARPAMRQFAGPALAGLIIAATMPATAFLVDSATFFLSAAMLLLIRARPSQPRRDQARPSLVAEVGEGLSYVRTHSWCWAYIFGIGLSLFAYNGPVEVLLPLILKNRLGLGEHGAAALLGLILASGGLGSIVASVTISERKTLPRRFVTIMYVAEAVGILALGVYGVMTQAWQGMIAALVANGLFAVGRIYWPTMLQRLVPDGLRSRVFSVDLLVSFGLLPASFVVAGALGAAVTDPREVILGAAALGSVVMLVLLWVPGVRDPERLLGPPATGLPGGPEGERIPPSPQPQA
jgi:DHA3 family tetracycline resistance protein-like MFS transporter